MRERALTLLRRFRRHQGGGLAVGFGMALGGLTLAAGVALDYSNASSERSRLQSVADAAALAGARQFRLGNASETIVKEAVVAFAKGSLGADADDTQVVAAADGKLRTATATLSTSVPSYVMQLVGRNATAVKASATARVAGGAPVCVVGLETEENTTVELEKTAKLAAPLCGVYSNSRKPNGLVVRDSALMVANFICSAGGKEASGGGTFLPQPKTDCPVLADPLQHRKLPTPGGCTATNLEVKGILVNLSPGTYCGGLKVVSGAIVTLFPGTYIFKDGPLIVNGGSIVTGLNVGLHFAGTGGGLRFEPKSVVTLTAPILGEMAGMLITEDRAAPLGQDYSIFSNDARTLLGTIYLPRGRLHVAANSPVGDLSAYTIIVARRFTLSEGPTMVLNTNYGATDIPVPLGLGPSGAASLVK